MRQGTSMRRKTSTRRGTSGGRRQPGHARAPAAGLGLGGVLLLGLGLPGGGLEAQRSMDAVIANGRIADGTGGAWFYGDVGIQGGRIVAVTPAGGLDDADAPVRIDATGKVVAPGFIDILSHARAPLLAGDGRLIGKITQGITTEIMGESTTNAPANANTWRAQGVDPASLAEGLDFSGARGFDRWLHAMLENGASPNFGSFIGATTVRIYGKAKRKGRRRRRSWTRCAPRWAGQWRTGPSAWPAPWSTRRAPSPPPTSWSRWSPLPRPTAGCTSPTCAPRATGFWKPWTRRSRSGAAPACRWRYTT